MKPLNEGIIYNENSDTFEFDFNSNSEKCIESLDSCHSKMTIEFSDLPLEQIDIDMGITYYFGYQFVNNDNASSKIRTKFFNSLRFSKDFATPENKRLFVVNALKKLHKHINVYTFDTIVYPKSRSYLNQYILKLLGNTVPNWEGYTIELFKRLPSEIEFDWKRWERNMKDSEKYVNEAAWDNAKKAIQLLLDKIHNQEYFSIAESVRKNKYKPYFSSYLYFEDESKQRILDTKKILLVDDVTTTGSTLFEAIKNIRLLNQDAIIVIFTLVGKKELHE